MKFNELPEGSKFQILLDNQIGMNIAYRKETKEDTYHNAVKLDEYLIPVKVPDYIEIIPMS